LKATGLIGAFATDLTEKADLPIWVDLAFYLRMGDETTMRIRFVYVLTVI